MRKFRPFPDIHPIRLEEHSFGSATSFVLVRSKSAMRSNLVSAVLQFLSPMVVERLGASTGLDTDMAQKAATAVVPSLLSGLAVLAAKPLGALQLESVIAEQPIDTLQSFSRDVPGSALQAAMGTNVLYSLLGGSALGMLTSAVSRF